MIKFAFFIFTFLLTFITSSKNINNNINYNYANNIKKPSCGSGNNNYEIKKVRFTNEIKNIKRKL